MSEWKVDISAEKATHDSGVEILFSGNPDSNSFDGKPTGFPPGLTAIEQVTLIRTGFEAYRTAYQEEGGPRRPNNHRKNKPPQVTTKRKSTSSKTKSNRPVMSLNR
ncbi:MAG: hypothetical protein MI976_03045 [Pseudomonadales bacterium]|nr:hypothetical protein [Pseudomonadales bacterium]